MKHYKRIISLTLAAFFIFSMLLLSGCSKSQDVKFDGAADEGNTYDETQIGGADSATDIYVGEADKAAVHEAAGNAKLTGLDIELHTPDNAKIIRTSYISMESTNFDETLKALSAKADSLGGYVENYQVSSTSYNTDSGRYSTLTVRVPADQFSAFTNAVGEYGNITSNEMNTEDITSQYTDVEARLTTLKTQETRLLELLAKAENVADMVTIEQRLSDVRYEIESLESLKKGYDERITYSTVHLNITEVTTLSVVNGVPKSFGEQLGQTLRSSFVNFGEFLKDALIGFVYALPYLLILAAIVVIILLAARRSSKKKRKAYPGMVQNHVYPVQNQSQDLKNQNLNSPASPNRTDLPHAPEQDKQGKKDDTNESK